MICTVKSELSLAAFAMTKGFPAQFAREQNGIFLKMHPIQRIVAQEEICPSVMLIRKQIMYDYRTSSVLFLL